METAKRKYFVVEMLYKEPYEGERTICHRVDIQEHEAFAIYNYLIEMFPGADTFDDTGDEIISVRKSPRPSEYGAFIISITTELLADPLPDAKTLYNFVASESENQAQFSRICGEYRDWEAAKKDYLNQMDLHLIHERGGDVQA